MNTISKLLLIPACLMLLNCGKGGQAPQTEDSKQVPAPEVNDLGKLNTMIDKWKEFDPTIDRDAIVVDFNAKFQGKFPAPINNDLVTFLYNHHRSFKDLVDTAREFRFLRLPVRDTALRDSSRVPESETSADREAMIREYYGRLVTILSLARRELNSDLTIAGYSVTAIINGFAPAKDFADLMTKRDGEVSGVADDGVMTARKDLLTRIFSATAIEYDGKQFVFFTFRPAEKNGGPAPAPVPAPAEGDAAAVMRRVIDVKVPGGVIWIEAAAEVQAWKDRITSAPAIPEAVREVGSE